MNGTLHGKEGLLERSFSLVMFVGKNWSRESVIYSLACLILTVVTGWFQLFIILPRLNFWSKNTGVFCVSAQI